MRSTASLGATTVFSGKVYDDRLGAAFGASLEDVVRTRVYLVNASDWEPVSLAHGRRFGAIRPANTLLQVGRLIGDYLVEIEAEAVVG